LVVGVNVRYKPLKASELLLLLLCHDNKSISEYRGVYEGGADDRVEWRGRTGGSSVRS
jgi:hypothetical protein